MTTTLGTHPAHGHDEAIRREYPGLLAYCRRLDRDSPEDLAQEATARTLQRLTVHDIDHLGAYLRTAARHARDDLVRSKYAHPIAVVATDELDAGTTRDRDVAEDLALHESLVMAFARLNARERVALGLAELDDLSLEDIAEALGTSPSGATSILYRARQKARAEIRRLRTRGMLAAPGPVSALREAFSGGGAQMVAGAAAAAAAIAVTASLGILGQGGAAPPVRPAAMEIARDAPSPDSATSAAAPPGPAATATAGASGTGGGPGLPPSPPAAPRSPSDRPSLRPFTPAPGIDREPLDASQKEKPVYVGSPEVDTDCDGRPDLFLVVADDPWGEDARPVFHGEPPPGLDGVAVRADASTTHPPSLCGPP